MFVVSTIFTAPVIHLNTFESFGFVQLNRDHQRPRGFPDQNGIDIVCIHHGIGTKSNQIALSSAVLNAVLSVSFLYKFNTYYHSYIKIRKSKM